MNWANYLIQINLYFMLFYAFYIMVLRNETFFNLNRTYLLSASAFALLIPLYRTDWVQSYFITEKVQSGWADVNVIMMQGFATPITEESAWAMGDYLTLIYLVGVVLLSLHLIYRLLLVKKMINSSNHPEAFSFFNKIIVNDNLPQKEQIEKHEQTHAKHFHSADVLFLEILCIINWFNPIMYLYKTSIRHIHEFIADEQALSYKSNKKDYAMLIFSKSFGINPNSLTNNFFNQSLLKRRIQMLQKPKSRKTAILKYGLSAPLFIIAMILSSATIGENKTIKQIENQIQPAKPIAEILMPKIVANLVSQEKKEDGKGIPAETKNSILEDDFTPLKKHLAKTLRYPTEAKNKELTSKIAFVFNINKSGRIENAKALNQINNELSEEGIRSLTSYTEKLDIDAGTYTIFITYKFTDIEKNITDETTKLGVIKNFIGEVVVSGYSNYPTAINEVKVTGYSSNKNDEDNVVFTNVEQLPSFPGGVKAFGEFLARNLKYPEKAKKDKIQGRVYLTFIIEKDGSLSGIKVARGIGSGCDEEAVRVLAKSPKWNPGKQNGKIVRVGYTIPIFFNLEGTEQKTGSIQTKPSGTIASSSNNPLYILDGIEIKGNKEELDKTIKPENIERIDVLKGENAILKYGEKGKDGVVEVTSKKQK